MEHPDHSGLEFWERDNRMEYKEGHTYPGNMGGQVYPRVNEMLG